MAEYTPDVPHPTAGVTQDGVVSHAAVVEVDLARQRRPDTELVDRLADAEPSTPTAVSTYGSQTHPADGAAGLIVTTQDRARELSGDGVARVLATGVARVGTALMPKAPVPAAHSALGAAGVGIADLHAITTHNPFAVNDLWFSARMGIPVERMNTYGSSLVYGHPQGPTGMRLIAELIETLRERGGGLGLFTGCAAGDTGAALVIEVTS